MDGILHDLIAPCPFCGQTTTLRIKDDMTQEEINNAVISTCSCAKAKLAQQLTMALFNIDQLFGEIAEENGLRKLPPEGLSILGDLATQRAHSHLISCTVNFAGGISAKISRNTKGYIEIQRTEKKAMKLSTE